MFVFSFVFLPHLVYSGDIFGKLWLIREAVDYDLK